MPKELKNCAMVDLHGLSSLDAERAVNYWLSTSASKGMKQIRFVTGRGNHLNNKGERGTLYRNFLDWIKKSPYKDRVECCKQHDGFFEVTLKFLQNQHHITDFFKTTAQQGISSNLEIIKTEAENGKVYFQMLYATLLEGGEEVKQDFKQAVKFYRLAADNHYPAAMHELARCYLHGVGLRQSDEQAFSWLQEADGLNYSESTVSLGDCYWRGQGVKQDARKAVSYYAKAASSHQYPLAMRKLASAYKQGIGIKQNLETAFSWYKKSAELGDVIAQYNVGSMYQNGIGIEPNDQEACRYWQLAAEGGDPDAQFFLGYSYWQGKGVKREQKQALYWLEKAAKNGSVQANHMLSEISDVDTSEIYLKRSGNLFDKVPVESTDKLDEKECKTLLHKSIRESFHLQVNDIILLDHDSKFLLIDSMILEGKARDKYKALSTIQSMAEQGCIFSLRRLAKFSSSGFNKLKIKKDPEQAIKYLQKAATLSDSKSMVSLGYFYEQGLGVQQSLPTALAYYQNAAKQHNPIACYKLANWHMEGLLEQSDLQRASEYVEQAIRYEKQDGLIRYLNSGPLDDYQPLGDSAALLLAKVSASIKNISKDDALEESSPENQWSCQMM